MAVAHLDYVPLATRNKSNAAYTETQATVSYNKAPFTPQDQSPNVVRDDAQAVR